MKKRIFITLIAVLLVSYILEPIGEQKNMKITAEQLIENLKNKIYTGVKTDMIRLNKAPVRNLFVDKKYGMEPLFAGLSGLKWKVDERCNIDISLKCDGIPWDKALSYVLDKYGLEIVLKNRVLVVQIRNKKNNVSKQKENFNTKGSENIVLSEIHRPEYLKIFKNNIYISDSGKIRVYSLGSFKFKNNIGKVGQGPGEFQTYPFVENMGKISLMLADDQIFIGSRNKVSYFKVSGELNKEIRIKDSMAFHLHPFGKGFAGIHVRRIPDWLYDFNLYNKKGKFIKKICSFNKNMHTSNVNKKGLGMVFIDKLSKGPEYVISKGRMYVSGSDGFSLEVFNTEGKRINRIKYDFKKNQILKKEKNKIINVYKESGKSFWNMAKNIIKIADFYPEFRTFRIDSDIIYFQTYNRLMSSTEFVLLTLDGKFVKKINIPLKYKNHIEPYPYTIYKNNIYCFIENENGDWEIYKELIERAN